MVNLDELDIAIYADADELVRVTLEEAISNIKAGLAKKGTFHLALTGGTLGNLLSQEISKSVNNSEFKGLHIWWSDERFVPFNSVDRNDLKVAEILSENNNIVLHRVSGEGDLSAAANQLDIELKDIDMDLNILGVGPDGHIASLFPNAIRAEEICNAFAVTDSPKPPKERITFSLQKINKSAEIWVIASGAEKADAIESFLDGENKLPVSHVKVSRLLMDAAAFDVDRG